MYMIIDCDLKGAQRTTPLHSFILTGRGRCATVLRYLRDKDRVYNIQRYLLGGVFCYQLNIENMDIVGVLAILHAWK